MIRSAIVIVTACLLVAGLGCTMCQHPYDYCGPTFTGDNCVPCDPLARAGSVLSPRIPTAGSGYAEGHLVPGSKVIHSDGNALDDELQEPTPAPPPRPQPIHQTMHTSGRDCRQCQMAGRSPYAAR